MRRRDLISVAAGASLATILSGGIAWAEIPAQSGTITGCYQKNVGNLRVVSSTDACHPSEIAITWNEGGQPGQMGDPGSAGREGRDALDGSGVTVVPEPTGPNCPGGGQKISAANGSTAFVCGPGLPPDPGEDM
jgi:hypothetical protein